MWLPFINSERVPMAAFCKMIFFIHFIVQSLRIHELLKSSDKLITQHSKLFFTLFEIAGNFCMLCCYSSMKSVYKHGCWDKWPHFGYCENTVCFCLHGNRFLLVINVNHMIIFLYFCPKISHSSSIPWDLNVCMFTVLFFFNFFSTCMLKLYCLAMQMLKVRNSINCCKMLLYA